MTRAAAGASPDGKATRGVPASGAPQRSAPGWGLTLAVLIVGVFMSILDTTIVNVAIDTIQNEFGVATDDAQWVVTAYSLTEGVVVPTTAWLGIRFGLKRVYNLAMLGFVAGSALCGLAWSLDSLVVFRIVQALSGGILPAITLSILFRIVPRGRLGAAMGMYGLGVVTAPAIGPSLGGYLVEYSDWRLIFLVNVPVGLLGLVAAVLVLPTFPARPGRRFDVLGFVTAAGGLFSLLLAVSEGPDWGWDSYPIVGLIIIGVLSLAFFVVIELEVDEPLLDIRIFRYRAFTHSLLLISILMVVIFGVLFYIPLFLQEVQGMGAYKAGLTLLPQALSMAVLMPISGRVYDRIGPRWLAVTGFTLVTIATYRLHTITAGTPREQIMWTLGILGSGVGCAMMPIFTGGIAVIPLAESNIASAFNNVVQRISGALGLPILTAIYTIQEAQLLMDRGALLPADTPVPDFGPTEAPWMGTYSVYQQVELQVFASAMDNLFFICSVLCALGALGALFLRSGPAPAAAGAGPPPQAAAGAASANGGAAERDGVPSTTAVAAGNDSPARPGSGLVNVETDARPRDT